MLAPELELADLDARHWRNAWRLLLPPRVRARARWALVVLDGGPAHVVRVAIAGGAEDAAAPVPPALAGVTEAALAAYAAQLGVDGLIVAERALLHELSTEIEAALRADHDGLAQALVALRAVKRHVGRGLWTLPALLELLPTPSHDALQRTFDLLVPDRAALVGFVVEDDRTRLHTSVIAVKDGGQITRVATHRAVADLVPEAALARDWTTGYKRVLAAVEDRFAAPAVGVFLERATLMRVLTGPSDQLARELNAKRVILDPAPAWLIGLLGGTAVAAVAGRVASGLAAMLPRSARDRASALAKSASTAMKESGAHPFALLGFDPLELWARVKHHYRER